MFLDDERLGGTDGTSGNAGGIALSRDGFLVVSTATDGMLFKVPLSSPHEFRPLGIPHPFPGADAILLAPDGFLYRAADAPGAQASLRAQRLPPGALAESRRWATE